MQLLDSDSYREFQNELLLNPELGKLIRGGAGIRKVRWVLPNKGKSGGIRIIYYYKAIQNTIYLLFAYQKNIVDNLSDKQVSQLAILVKDL